jgi:hypothetical protein
MSIINSFFNTVSVCMFAFKKYDRQYHVWSFMTKYLRFLCKFTSWSGETPTGNFSDVFFYLGQECNFSDKSEIFCHKTSHMVLFIIFLEDKHNIVLHVG